MKYDKLHRVDFTDKTSVFVTKEVRREVDYALEAEAETGKPQFVVFTTSTGITLRTLSTRIGCTVESDQAQRVATDEMYNDLNDQIERDEGWSPD